MLSKCLAKNEAGIYPLKSKLIFIIFQCECLIYPVLKLQPEQVAVQTGDSVLDDGAGRNSESSTRGPRLKLNTAELVVIQR